VQEEAGGSKDVQRSILFQGNVVFPGKHVAAIKSWM